ncbi:MAG: hypothetical protein EXR74_00910 [Bdellovibrionales bacterium]|nr:hypothetical protein [Bdellovibrionales bacterium]
MRNLKHLFGKATLFYLIGGRLLIPTIGLASHEGNQSSSPKQTLPDSTIRVYPNLLKAITDNLTNLKSLDNTYPQKPTVPNSNNDSHPSTEIQSTYDNAKKESDSKIKVVIDSLKKQLEELNQQPFQWKSKEKTLLKEKIETAISEHTQTVETEKETVTLTKRVRTRNHTSQEITALNEQIRNLRDSILNHVESSDPFGIKLAEQYKETLGQLAKLEKELNSKQKGSESNLNSIPSSAYNQDSLSEKPSAPLENFVDLSEELIGNPGPVTNATPLVAPDNKFKTNDYAALTDTNNSSHTPPNNLANKENLDSTSNDFSDSKGNFDSKNNTSGSATSDNISFKPSSVTSNNLPKIASTAEAKATNSSSSTSNFYSLAPPSATAPNIDNPAKPSAIEQSLPATPDKKWGANSDLGFSMREQDPNAPNVQVQYTSASALKSDSFSTAPPTSYDSSPSNYDPSSSNSVSNKPIAYYYNNDGTFSREEPYTDREIASIEINDFKTVPTLEAPVKTDELTKILEELREASDPMGLSNEEIPKLLVAQTTLVDSKKSLTSVALAKKRDPNSRGPSLFDRLVTWLGI